MDTMRVSVRDYESRPTFSTVTYELVDDDLPRDSLTAIVVGQVVDSDDPATKLPERWQAVVEHVTSWLTDNGCRGAVALYGANDTLAASITATCLFLSDEDRPTNQAELLAAFPQIVQQALSAGLGIDIPAPGA